MNKQVLWLFLVIVIGYLAIVFCDENVDSAIQSVNGNEIQNDGRELLDEEARTRRRHKIFHLFWGWHALAIAYWIKVKVVIVSFFLGSAVFLGLRYFWPHKCTSDISHDGPIIYENPHDFSHHHDHIPYSLDHSDHSFSEHSFPTSSFDSYPGFSGTGFSDVAPTVSGEVHNIKRRSLEQDPVKARKNPSTEEQIGDLMFSFLGLDSKACRRRFICEMEYRSKLNPLSSMVFRIAGRAFFEKYTNDKNKHGKASSFEECAVVNSDCEFVGETSAEQHEETEAENNDNEANDTNEANEVSNEESNNTQEAVEKPNDNEIDADLETQNNVNLEAERRVRSKRRRTNKKLDVDIVAERIFAQKN